MIRIITVNIKYGKYISWLYSFGAVRLRNIQSIRHIRYISHVRIMRDIIGPLDVNVIGSSDINIFIKMQCRQKKLG
ncbi:hypothetical protein MSSIH_2712 [Methanosarcina siciliae HI350]|uniref:Uncharacterized protein n=1 Tax=Methanosarcina siciliae HI350 TaxID=1434119 RepID=A0A0E3PFK4_9EURY|nr:hypothetical protein MSSIH_2712 [Methanosarcina siciliae HI350]